MLAQIKTEDTSDEITAIPKLLDLLNIKDSYITNKPDYLNLT